MTITARQYLESLLYVKDRETAQMVPLVMKPAQQLYLEQATLRDIILKSRRMGMSTIIGAEFFSEQQTSMGLDCKVVAHTSESTGILLEMVKGFHQNLPEKIQQRTERFNTNVISFPDLNATYSILTAGGDAIGRASAIYKLHCSEVAFWEDDPYGTFKGLSECVPVTGKIRIESTPNGIGNMLHQMYQDAKLGKSSYKAFFFPWWHDLAYSLAIDSPLTLADDRKELNYTQEEMHLVLKNGLDEDQMRWRRWKKQGLGDEFLQEYPEDDVSCFLIAGTPFFDKSSVYRLFTLAIDPIETHQVGTGKVKVWSKPDPKDRYAMGGDASEGLEGQDRAAAFIYSLNTGRQAVTMHGYWTPTEFAFNLNEWGRLYNNAYLGIENDKWGALVLDYLESIYCYPNLHYHVLGNQKVTIGYPIGTLYKFTCDNELNDAIKYDELLIWDKEVIGEMGSYVKLSSGKLGATTGTHDDLVSAAKIAWQMRKFAPTRPIAKTEPVGTPRLALTGTRRDAPAFKRYLERV